MKAPSDSGESASESSESESEQTKTAPETLKQQQHPPPPLQQQRAEEEEEEDEEEESETDSDDEAGGARYDAVKRDGFPVAKGVATVEQPAAKRGRDVNGMVEEPGGKRRKDGKEEKTRGQQPAKAASPVKPVKSTRPKTERARAVIAVKADSAKPQMGATRKRKLSPVPVSSSRQASKKGEADKTSPSKVKKAAAHWSSNLEQSLASLMLRDKSSGFTIPISRLDLYWDKLLKRLPLNEGDITELQLVDKVKRMRSRYHFLDKKFAEEGVRTFKNAHEEQMFQTWEGIWGTGMDATAARAVASQPATEEEDSDEGSEETASPAGDATGATVQVGDESSEEDENGEDDVEKRKRKTAGLNQVGTAGKGVVTPFVSKPRLEFTPRLPRDDQRKGSRKAEDVVGGDHRTGAASAGDGGRQREINSLVSEQLRAEILAVFQEIRGNYFHFAEDIPGFGSLMGGLGSISLGKGFGNSAMEKLVGGGGNDGASRLQKKWQQHKVKELALFSERLQLLQEQCRLQQEELKLHMHS